MRCFVSVGGKSVKSFKKKKGKKNYDLREVCLLRDEW